MQLASLARIRAENQGRVLAEGLGRMVDRYGTPAESDLMIFLAANGQADESLALSLARAFRHYWSSDYEACVHVVVPKIEAAARALLRELDEGIYRLQAAKDPGKYPGLYVLIEELEKLALDESWAYFLRWLLLGPAGQNLRNEVAHGFVRDISPVYAALVLRAAALLITLVAPQPPSAAHVAMPQGDRVIDLAELPGRDRDEILALLAQPVPDPVPFPWRDGAAGRRVSPRRRCGVPQQRCGCWQGASIPECSPHVGTRGPRYPGDVSRGKRRNLRLYSEMCHTQRNRPLLYCPHGLAQHAKSAQCKHGTT